MRSSGRTKTRTRIIRILVFLLLLVVKTRCLRSQILELNPKP
jgi:hypothetical protein